MRTADRMIARDWSFPLGIDENKGFMDYVAEGVRSSPVVVADNVAHYVHQRNETPAFDHYPSLAPPWPSFWVEYPSQGRQRRGVWVMDTTEWPEEHFRELADGARRHALLAEGVNEDDLRWIVSFVLFIEDNRSIWGPAGIFSLALDTDGRVIGNRWSIAPVKAIRDAAQAVLNDKPADYREDDQWQVPTEAEMRAMTPEQREAAYQLALRHQKATEAHLEQLNGRVKELDTAAKGLTAALVASEAEGDYTPTDEAEGTYSEAENAWLWRALAPAMHAVAFLHCRNVVVDEIDPPAKVQARRRRKGKEPLLRYHTLRLDVPRKSGRGGDGRKHDIGSPALHIVAGHFAHYGNCCPGQHDPHGRLFGRLEGVYWMPSHARGSKSVGRVHTDFDLKPIETA